MKNYVIITDSSCDLSQTMVEKLGITVLPLSVLMEGESYYNYSDNREIEPKNFYHKLRQGVVATTNAANIGEATEGMRPILKSGLDILVLAFSSGLSTTYHSFRIAAADLQEAFPQRKILIVDTCCASAGQGLLIYLASRLREEGNSIEQVYHWVEDNKLRICHWVTVDDLMHLKRGGRISPTTALMGSLLSMKPIIAVTDEGKLETVGKVRGRKAALATLLNQVKALPAIPQVVFVGHADCLRDACYLQEQLYDMGVAIVEVGYIGPVIGAHTGPGCIVISFLGQQRS